MEIKYKLDNAALTWSYFNTETDKLICVSNRGRSEVTLCHDEPSWQEFAKIKLHHGGRAKDADAVFDDAVELGKEIARRWNAGAKER